MFGSKESYSSAKTKLTKLQIDWKGYRLNCGYCMSKHIYSIATMNQKSQVITLVIILIIFFSGSCVAFQSLSLQKLYDTQSVVNHHHPLLCDAPFATKLASKVEGSEDEAEAISVEDDDNGWGTGAKDDFDEKTKELGALQNSRQASLEARRTQSATEGERDLFIPIFAIVSLLGLFGSYGYEMLRLASRGELYLPWNN